MITLIREAAKAIKNSAYTIAFTGAGISVESGIPPFRGEHGLWNKYDPRVLELDYYHRHEEECWQVIREIFYDFFTGAKPNKAHEVLAGMEQAGLLQAVVTQNIDNLHQLAGSRNVFEFHGSSSRLKCPGCRKMTAAAEVDFNRIPPRCPGDGLILKPDFIFFGEGIPYDAYNGSFAAAERAEVCLIVGSTGEVAPASFVPRAASQNGAMIIEINPETSNFTNQITDIYLKGKAGEVLALLEKELF